MPAASTAIAWFRRDLRLHDLPMLAEACREFDRVVPLFVFDPRLLAGRFRSANRTRWLLECLDALDGELRGRGGRLVVRHGDVATEVAQVARDTGATAVYVSADVTGFARARDTRVEEALASDGVELRRRPGVWIADLGALRTGAGRPYTVYSPFRRRWEAQARRPIERRPQAVELPGRLAAGRLPGLADLGFEQPPALIDTPEPGEAGAAKAARSWLEGGLADYDTSRDTLAGGTSRLSAHLRYGTLSPLALEHRVLERTGDGPSTFRQELAWRDFYAAVQLHFPWTARTEFVERYRALDWDDPADHFEAWAQGRTGYPVVDAAMRQLRAMGWMHNRARMVVGSFLTKDLQLDWRLGEAEFMDHLLDGDVPSNNGGWQWIASTGTDPAPYFQRLFNPMTQQDKFDADGAYVRRWCPELARVPDKKLSTPWTMSPEEQQAAGCVIGVDYPEPVVDHKQARLRAIERYRAVAEG